MAERSKELIEVGYYLSKYGISKPPARFGKLKWNEVYKMFYNSLGQGRKLLEFEHSLKNTRDGFDSYFTNTQREGWKDKDGNPAKLPLDAKDVFDHFEDISEEEVYDRIKIHLSKFESTNKSLPLSFESITGETKLTLNEKLINRFISSLLTKPFVILTGLSGSGKTKLAQAFAMWMSGSKEQYAIVPVGADWTNREPLLGYPNSLKAEHYVKPDSGVLDILLSANRNFIENDGDLSLCKPFFLILDEMNLSHVERYFADFLSAMESGDEIKLYSGTERYDNLDEKGAPILGEDPIPNAIVLPKNLFIIGTVNIDETTYMFSPKVLDRANTIEFRISKDEMAKFLDKHEPLDMEQLLEDVSNQIGKGASQTSTFMTLATRKNLKIERNLHLDVFVSFFKELQFAGAEFGYRTANEMSVLVGYLTYFGLSENDAYDIAIMQKMLPKLHGSRSKLGRILPALIELCENKYPISFEKLTRMKKSAEENGFASYAEA
jgi:5-methylcytosine-specific restriction protein B